MACRRSHALPLAIGALLVTFSAACAQQSYTLRYHPNAGHVQNYTASVAGKGTLQLGEDKQQLQLSGSLSLAEKCLGSYKGGARLVEVRLLGGKLALAADQPAMELDEARLVVARDALGRIVEVKDSQGLDLAAGGLPLNLGALTSALSQVTCFPAQPVPVGGSWSSTQNIPLGDQRSLAISSRSVLKLVARQGSRSVAVIDSQLTVPLEIPLPSMNLALSGKIAANLRSFVFLDDGALYKSICRAAVNLVAYTTREGKQQFVGRLQLPDLTAQIAARGAD